MKESTMSNGRQASRSPGRTPPFILVGLLVLVCVLAYNYWSLSATNSDLNGRNEKMDLELRSAAEAHDSTRKDLAETQERLHVAEKALDQVREQIKERDGDLTNLRSEQSKMEAEDSKCKEDLTKCDGELAQKGETLESVIAEKRVLEEQIASLQLRPETCGFEQCIAPVQNLVAIFKQVADHQKLRQALTEASLDANKIMGPPENPPPQDQGAPAPQNQGAPAPQNQGAPAPQDQVAPVPQDQAAPVPQNPAEQPQQGAPQQQGAPDPNAPQQPAPQNGESAPKPDDKVTNSTGSSDTPESQASSTPASSNVTSEKLVFQPATNVVEEEVKNVDDQIAKVDQPADGVISENIDAQVEVKSPNDVKTSLQMGEFEMTDS